MLTQAIMHTYVTLESQVILGFESNLHLSSRTNATLCPQCGRNENGGKVNPHLKLTSSLSDIKQMLPPHFMKNVDRVNICGNYG